MRRQFPNVSPLHLFLILLLILLAGCMGMMLLQIVFPSRAHATERKSSVPHEWDRLHHVQHDHFWPLFCGGADSVENMHFTFGPKEQEKERLEQDAVHHRNGVTCETIKKKYSPESCTPDWCIK